MKDKLVSFLISPWFLALPVALIIVYFLPPIDKYKIELIKKGICDKPGCHVTLVDLDGDGDTEKVILFNNQQGDAAIKIIDQSDVLIGWWDFKGSIYKDAPKTGDYDHDGRPEIYFVSNANDSLFLNILCPGPGSDYITNQRFITPTQIKDHENDYTAGGWQFCDLQLDGTDEVLFTIFAGYSLQPRRLYAYDQKNDSLLAGPLMGCQVSFFPVQLNDDPYSEWLGKTSSTGNMPQGQNIPYKDSSSWLMALDHKLNLIFAPIEFKGHKTTLESQVAKFDKDVTILSLFEFSSRKPWRPALLLHDTHGNLIKKKELDKPTGQVFYSLLHDPIQENKRVLMKDVFGSIFIIDKDLNLNKIAQLPEDCNSHFESIDLDDDGLNELVFISANYTSLYIIRNDFSHISKIEIPFERTKSFLSKQENGKSQSFLFIQRGEREMWFSYGFNKLWYAKFPLWLSIYILVIGFTHIIRKSQLIQQKKAKAREDQLAELQLGAVSTYLDPHFTFNILNTITSLIYKEEKVKAHEVITRFTSLIRSTLMQSGKVSRSLGEELEFVKNYLDIQRFRFGNSFTWEIRNEDNIDLSLPVPKMMVHQYVENAIKHGLKNKGAGGKLHIILLRQDKETIVVIRDNGVGRNKAKIYNEPGTGKGLLTMQQIFDLFEKTNKIKISPTINDLMDDSGNSSGTEVILTIRKV